MGLGRYNDDDLPSRPSSANSLNSNSSGNHYSYGHNNYNNRDYSYDNNHHRGNGGRFDTFRTGVTPMSSRPRTDFGNVSQDLMRKNAGQIGLDPTEMAPIKKEFYTEHPEVASMTVADVEAFRRTAQMSIVGKNVPKPVTSFKQAGFPEPIVKKLSTTGYSSPTPIQAQGWTMALSGQNMVGIAQTGSGKTLSFILPALVHIKGQAPLARGDGPIALVLAPTRELAVQIQEVARVYGNTIRINSTCLYGGAPKSGQIRNVRSGCEIIVATPGRLLDLVNENIFDLRRCSFLVLDEADRMLDMGFEPQIRQILTQIRIDRQVLMWSATWPKNVMRLAHDMLGRDFIQVTIGAAELNANKKIKQMITVCDPMEKKERLSEIMQKIWDSIPGEESQKQMVRTIIFCNKKSTVDYITNGLLRDNWPAVAIHGDKLQHERDRAIRQLKSGEYSILVATDVAARGLDVKDVKAVINFDLPQDIENYVHRIGRTARGDALEGDSFTLVTSEDAKVVNDLIKIMSEAGQPIPDELAKMRRGGGGGRGPSRAGYAAYGRGRSNNSNGYGFKPKQHIRYSPY